MSGDKSDWRLVVIIATTLLKTTLLDAEKINLSTEQMTNQNSHILALCSLQRLRAVWRNKAPDWTS